MGTVLGTVILLLGMTLGWEAKADQKVLVDTRNTRIAFLDACSDEEVAMETPAGVRLLVEMWDLLPGDPLHVEVDITPAEGVKGSPLHLESDIIASADGHYQSLRKITFPKPEGLEAGIWNAQVRWQQPGMNGHAGASSTGIYLISRFGKQFFRVDGPSICRWERPAKIDSQYYYNLDNQTMTLSRGAAETSSISDIMGLGLGYNPSSDPSDHFGHVPMMKHGWFFAGWYHSWKATTEFPKNMGQSWNLIKGQGGYFTERLSYVRLPVSEFVEEDVNGCKAWREARHGTLDVGKLVTEFEIVPQSLSTDLKASEDFIETIRPTINSCARLPRPEPRTADPGYLVTGPNLEGEQAMYFYPTRE